ncbi:KRAB-A domain-containing protein 2-like [Anthonomus grandis grandis]|uniref:KRAB-A domain-containing protein 2-like n=1 Tax=Anthonomus grandis grandis TaxID=2921223 RepID=UPI002166A978|nr:KRAB-A domain-containing protein 2-like [Anthonomus grandis grandis]
MQAEFESQLVRLLETSGTQKHNLMGKDHYLTILNDLKEANLCKAQSKTLSAKQYRRIKCFDITSISAVEKLIQIRKEDSDAILYFVSTDEVFPIVHQAHISTGHKRHKGISRNNTNYLLNLMSILYNASTAPLARQAVKNSYILQDPIAWFSLQISLALEEELKKKYANITRETINIYLKLCEICQLKKTAPRKGIVVKPILSKLMNSRCQVDLIDMQTDPDGDYSFILNYQDHLTKYCVLRPMKSRTAVKTARNLIEMFCLFGAPSILHSDNGREFSNQVINNLKCQWPHLKIVHGKPCHSQGQGSVGRCNRDVRDALIC